VIGDGFRMAATRMKSRSARVCSWLLYNESRCGDVNCMTTKSVWIEVSVIE
jgi:hypothetical protein